MKKLFLAILSFIVIFMATVTPALAVNTPDFGSCQNPQIAASQINYGSNHGVIGQTQTYSGKDTIYQLSNGNVTQCLCPDSGTGIQTNWYKVSGLSESDIHVLEKEGWTYVVTGSSWGLEDVPYLAKNVDYSCHGEQVLAATGTDLAIFGLILAAVISISAGLILRKFSK